MGASCIPDMAALTLFFRLIVRPALREPGRSLLVAAAVAVGTAVVLAIDLAGNAAAGSFRSSLETMAGDNNLEVTAGGECPRRWRARWRGCLTRCASALALKITRRWLPREKQFP